MATEVLDRKRIEQAFTFFETRKTLLTNFTEQWQTLTSHFTSLEQSIAQKTETLDSKLESVDSEAKKTLESLEQRETSLPDREASLIARVEEQKQAALAEFEKTLTGDAEIGEALKSFCRRMDSGGLLRYMTAKRKEAMTLRIQIAPALEEAVDAPRLVLDAVKDFLEKKDVKVGASDRRRACGNLIMALFPVEEKAGPVATSIAERALTVAEAWKGKIDKEEKSGEHGHVDSAMFLQFLFGFGLVSKFEEEFLKNLIMENSARRDMPKLALALGFGEKMPDIIDELVKNGKEIDAVYFAFDCGLTERFPPVDLLKNHLKKSRTEATTILKNSRYSSTGTENAGNLELNALRSIIKCVEDHKFDSKYPLQSLKKRVSQLEKLKADKRKSASTSSKRPRGGGPSVSRPSKYGRGPESYSSYGHRGSGGARQSSAATYSGSYNYPSQSGYKGPPSTSYTPQYGGHIRSPAAIPPLYSHPAESVGAPGAPAASLYGAQTNYGAYDYSAVAPTGYQPSYPQ